MSELESGQNAVSLKVTLALGNVRIDKSYFEKYTDGEKLFRENLDGQKLSQEVYGRTKVISENLDGRMKILQAKFGKIDRIWSNRQDLVKSTEFGRIVKSRAVVSCTPTGGHTF